MDDGRARRYARSPFEAPNRARVGDRGTRHLRWVVPRAAAAGRGRQVRTSHSAQGSGRVPRQRRGAGNGRGHLAHKARSRSSTRSRNGERKGLFSSKPTRKEQAVLARFIPVLAERRCANGMRQVQVRGLDGTRGRTGPVAPGEGCPGGGPDGGRSHRGRVSSPSIAFSDEVQPGCGTDQQRVGQGTSSPRRTWRASAATTTGAPKPCDEAPPPAHQREGGIRTAGSDRGDCARGVRGRGARHIEQVFREIELRSVEEVLRERGLARFRDGPRQGVQHGPHRGARTEADR